MTRSSDSLIPSGAEQSAREKRDDKASVRRTGGEANPRAATQVNAVAASSTPPAIKPTQLDLFPGRACPLKAKPATDRSEARDTPVCRDGVKGGGTRRKRTKITGEPLFGPAVKAHQGSAPAGREAYKSRTRNRRTEAEEGVGGGHSTAEPRDNRGEERAATSTTRSMQGKAAGLRSRESAQPRQRSQPRPKRPKRMEKARKLQRALYRAAKLQPERKFTLLYDKICRLDILREAWRRVKANKGAAGVDGVSIDEVLQYGDEKFLDELRGELVSEKHRIGQIRRVYIPKPGQPGRSRALGIPNVKDRVVQMATKLVIEPLFEADFQPCSYGFRPKRTPRMALTAIVANINAGYTHIVDVDLASFFDTLDHGLLVRLVERRIGDRRVLRLIRAWLKADILEEGKLTHPTRGSPQGGVISPLLSNIFLHEIDRGWCDTSGGAIGPARLVRYADDIVLMARSKKQAQDAWTILQQQVRELCLSINQDKSKITTIGKGFAFLGFEFRRFRNKLYLWPRAKARRHIGERMRRTVRSVPNSAPLHEVVKRLNPVLNGWCTYFRVGNSNRAFHVVDWMARSEIQLWLRRKHRCTWRHAKKRWDYRFLHERCRLYRMVGKVSHLEGLRRTLPNEGGRRAVCGKTARTVR